MEGKENHEKDEDEKDGGGGAGDYLRTLNLIGNTIWAWGQSGDVWPPVGKGDPRKGWPTSIVMETDGSGRECTCFSNFLFN